MERSDKNDKSGKGEPGDEEKPFKKARYVWEVKGKHHLKNSSSGPPSNLESSSTFQEEDEGLSGVGNLKKEGSVSIHPTNPSISPIKNCCIETFLAKTEDIMDRDSSDEDDDDESEKLPLENSIEDEIPVTLVSVQPRNQDYYLRKWQARQIARGFVDNTINSMLENWVDRPFDAVNFVEDCENDGQVEDDAILMAIQSHGLQSGWRGGLSPGQSSLASNSHFNSNSNSSFNSNFAMAGSSRSESRTDTLASNSVLQESTLDNYENLQKEQENESSMASSSSSMSVDTASSVSNPYEGDLGDPMDFLNAAVSVAIQKKGLTYG